MEDRCVFYALRLFLIIFFLTLLTFISASALANYSTKPMTYDQKIIHALKTHVCEDGNTVEQIVTEVREVTKRRFLLRGYSVIPDENRKHMACLKYNIAPRLAEKFSRKVCWQVSKDLQTVSPFPNSVVPNIIESGKIFFLTYVNEKLSRTRSKDYQDFFQDAELLAEIPTIDGRSTARSLLKSYNAKIHALKINYIKPGDQHDFQKRFPGMYIAVDFTGTKKELDNTLFKAQHIIWYKVAGGKKYSILRCDTTAVICKQFPS